jgi:transitional endoplasmic reticulum ATPase
LITFFFFKNFNFQITFHTDILEYADPSPHNTCVISPHRPAFAHLGAVPPLLISQLHPHLHPARSAKLCVSPASGILLAGPPGVSKTSLAAATASALGASLWVLRPSSVMAKYVGEAERAVRECFAAARSAPPAVIIIDEVDGLAASRDGVGAGSGSGFGSGSGSSVGERVLSTLLNEMDGVGAGGGVLVIGTTNRPDRVDAALRRPGRFERTVLIGLPDCGERAQILDAIVRRGAVPLDAATVDLDAVAAATEGMSGADLENVIREAAMCAIRDSDGSVASTGAADVDDTTTRIEQRHLVAAVNQKQR